MMERKPCGNLLSMFLAYLLNYNRFIAQFVMIYLKMLMNNILPAVFNAFPVLFGAGCCRCHCKFKARDDCAFYRIGENYQIICKYVL